MTSSLDSTSAATHIQSLCRSYLARKDYRELEAVVTIQNVFRYYAARSVVEQQLLPSSLYKDAISYIPKIGLLPKARDGNKSVYYLPDVVIKKCNEPPAIEVFAEMCRARQVCEENGFKHIYVPLASAHKDFLFVERVFFSPHAKVQIGVYLTNSDLFTEAVKEFAEFYFRTTVLDLVHSRARPNKYASVMNQFEYSLGRYDNFALLKNGRIGLVDLDGFSSVSTRHSLHSPCINLISLFPKHLDVIIEVVEKFEPKLLEYDTLFKNQKDAMLDCFRLIYTEHLEFAKRKKISVSDPKRFDEFSNKDIAKLWDYVSKKLEEETKRGRFKKCLRRNTLSQFRLNVFPELVSRIHQAIAESFAENIDCYKRICSMEELLGARTLKFDIEKSVSQMSKFLLPLDMFNVKKPKQLELLHRIVSHTLKGLKPCDLVAYYNPEFGFPPNQIHCLFC